MVTAGNTSYDVALPPTLHDTSPPCLPLKQLRGHSSSCFNQNVVLTKLVFPCVAFTLNELLELMQPHSSPAAEGQGEESRGGGEKPGLLF